MLFDRHAPRIHRYVARRIGRQAADDVVAETFLAAFAKRRQLLTRATGTPRPWLYGIATNLISQHRREEASQFRTRRRRWPIWMCLGPADRVAADVTAARSAACWPRRWPSWPPQTATW